MDRETLNATAPWLLAEQAAEAVRWLNHRTLVGAGYDYPSDVDATLAQLEAMAQRTPQALAQAAFYLRDLDRRNWIGNDEATDPTGQLVGLAEYLAEAGRTAEQLASLLRLAHQLSARLTYIGPDLAQYPDPADRSDVAGGYL